MKGVNYDQPDQAVEGVKPCAVVDRITLAEIRHQEALERYCPGSLEQSDDSWWCP